MTTDLATRMQRFIDSGAAPVMLDEVAHRHTRSHASGPKYGLAAAVVVLLVVAIVGGLLAFDGDDSERIASVGSASVPLAQVSDGVTVQQFGERLAFVVRDGNRFTVFDTNVQHLRGENGLWWCPNEQIFVAPTHAETFSRSGQAIGGPAVAGLDRFRVTVRNDRLNIDPTHVIPGTKGNAHTAAGQTGGNDVGPWDSGPGSFCAGALKANNAVTPTSVLNVKTTGPGGYDKKIYNVPTGLIEIRLSGVYGITFTFDDPRYQYCLLAPEPGERHTCRVSLSPGDYLVYDTVPGHQQAGYEATIRVAATPEPSQSPSSTTPLPRQPTTP